MSECRTCSAPIRWVEALTGARMPIDVAPRADGNVVLEAGGKARVLKKGEPHTGPRFVSHFSTCPQAGTWRKKA